MLYLLLLLFTWSHYHATILIHWSESCTCIFSQRVRVQPMIMLLGYMVCLFPVQSPHSACSLMRTHNYR